MSHCLISLTVSLDGATYIPNWITPDGFKTPFVLVYFGHISNSFRSAMLQNLMLFSGEGNDDVMFLISHNFVSYHWYIWTVTMAVETYCTFNLVELIAEYSYWFFMCGIHSIQTRPIYEIQISWYGWMSQQTNRWEITVCFLFATYSQRWFL